MILRTISTKPGCVPPVGLGGPILFNSGLPFTSPFVNTPADTDPTEGLAVRRPVHSIHRAYYYYCLKALFVKRRGEKRWIFRSRRVIS
jgi:hypothetical protein